MALSRTRLAVLTELGASGSRRAAGDILGPDGSEKTPPAAVTTGGFSFPPKGIAGRMIHSISDLFDGCELDREGAKTVIMDDVRITLTREVRLGLGHTGRAMRTAWSPSRLMARGVAKYH